MSKSHLMSKSSTPKKCFSQKQPDPYSAPGSAEAQQVLAQAAAGASGGGFGLPYLDQLQASFGGYDLSGAKAHQNPDAAAEIGANAYTLGSDVVFGESPDKKTAAEEAVHYLTQSAGMMPSAGVGSAGDPFEVDAKKISEKAGAGEDVESDLDAIIGGPQRVGSHPRQAVQRQEADKKPPVKKVSELAMRRLQMAQEANAYAKAMLSKGAGNQAAVAAQDNGNAAHRVSTNRGGDTDSPHLYFNMTPELQALADANPEAFLAAKGRVTQSGNCDEFSQMAFDYIRRTYPDEAVHVTYDKEGDHKYVTMGEPGSADAVVAESWAQGAMLEQDHWVGSKNNVGIHQSSNGDSTDYIQQILDAGLSLNEAGLAEIQKTFENAEDQQNAVDSSYPDMNGGYANGPVQYVSNGLPNTQQGSPSNATNGGSSSTGPGGYKPYQQPSFDTPKKNFDFEQPTFGPKPAFNN